MRDLHEVLAWVMIAGAGAVGAWITAANWLPALRHRTMWWAAHAVFAVTVVQVMVGVALQSSVAESEADGTHTFYGFLAFVTVGIIVGYRQLSQYRLLLYGLGSLFLMGLGIRLLFL